MEEEENKEGFGPGVNNQGYNLMLQASQNPYPKEPKPEAPTIMTGYDNLLGLEEQVTNQAESLKTRVNQIWNGNPAFIGVSTLFGPDFFNLNNPIEEYQNKRLFENKFEWMEKNNGITQFWDYMNKEHPSLTNDIITTAGTIYDIAKKVNPNITLIEEGFKLYEGITDPVVDWVQWGFQNLPGGGLGPKASEFAANTTVDLAVDLAVGAGTKSLLRLNSAGLGRSNWNWRQRFRNSRLTQPFRPVNERIIDVTAFSIVDGPSIGRYSSYEIMKSNSSMFSWGQNYRPSQNIMFINDFTQPHSISNINTSLDNLSRSYWGGKPPTGKGESQLSALLLASDPTNKQNRTVTFEHVSINPFNSPEGEATLVPVHSMEAFNAIRLAGPKRAYADAWWTHPKLREYFPQFKRDDKWKAYVEAINNSPLIQRLLNEQPFGPATSAHLTPQAHHNVPLIRNNLLNLFEGVAWGSEEHINIIEAFIDGGLLPGTTNIHGRSNISPVVGMAAHPGYPKGSLDSTSHSLSHAALDIELDKILRNNEGKLIKITGDNRGKITNQVIEALQRATGDSYDFKTIFDSVIKDMPNPPTFEQFLEVAERKITDTGEIRLPDGSTRRLTGLNEMVRDIARETVEDPRYKTQIITDNMDEYGQKISELNLELDQAALGQITLSAKKYKFKAQRLKQYEKIYEDLRRELGLTND